MARYNNLVSMNGNKPASRAVRQYKAKHRAPKPSNQVARLKSKLAKCYEDISGMSSRLHQVQVLTLDPIVTKAAGDVLAHCLRLTPDQLFPDAVYFTRYTDHPHRIEFIMNRIEQVLQALGDRSTRFCGQLNRCVNAQGVLAAGQNPEGPQSSINAAMQIFKENPGLKEDFPVQHRVLIASRRKLRVLLDVSSGDSSRM
jgi:hypothetical protein